MMKACWAILCSALCGVIAGVGGADSDAGHASVSLRSNASACLEATDFGRAPYAAHDYYPNATPGMVLLQNHGSKPALSFNGVFLFNSTGELVACALVKDVLELDIIPDTVASEAFFQHAQFADDQSGSRVDYECNASPDLVLTLQTRRPRVGEVTVQPVFVTIVTDMEFNFKYYVQAKADPDVFKGDASHGRHDAFIGQEPNQVFIQVWDVRFHGAHGNLTFPLLDGTHATPTEIAQGGFQIQTTNGTIVKSYTGWGDDGDLSCSRELRCSTPYNEPMRYAAHSKLQSAPKKGTSGTHTNSFIQVAKEHWDPQDLEDGYLQNERFAGTVNKINGDGTIDWRFHGISQSNWNTRTDFPWEIVDDPLGGPSDMHHANVEHLEKNHIMVFENGVVLRADPCQNLTDSEKEDFNLSEECQRPPVERRGCPFSRVTEWKIEKGQGTINGTFGYNKATLVWSYPSVDSLPVMLPHNETYYLKPGSDQEAAKYCMPFWERHTYSSFISGARRLRNGNTVIAWHDCFNARCSSGADRPLPPESVIMEEVARGGDVVNKFVVPTGSPKGYAAYRVDFLQDCSSAMTAPPSSTEAATATVAAKPTQAPKENKAVMAATEVNDARSDRGVNANGVGAPPTDESTAPPSTGETSTPADPTGRDASSAGAGTSAVRDTHCRAVVCFAVAVAWMMGQCPGRY